MGELSSRGGVCEVLKKLNDREVTIGQLSKAERVATAKGERRGTHIQPSQAMRKQGAFFGEIAVLYDMPRTATVRGQLCKHFWCETFWGVRSEVKTQTGVIALALSRADILQQLSKEAPSPVFFRQRVYRVQVWEFWASLWVVNGAPSRGLGAHEAHCTNTGGLSVCLCVCV